MKFIIRNQKGQGIMEYVIISSLIGIICLAAVKSLGGVIKTRVSWMEKDIVNTIKSPSTR
jgi:Flp pilus assembly pilin Flp